LRIFEHAYGRAPDQPLEPDDLPEDPDELANLSWDRLRTLAARYSVELDGNGDAGQEPGRRARADFGLTQCDGARNHGLCWATPDVACRGHNRGALRRDRVEAGGLTAGGPRPLVCCR
jgi:hypothetical protein